MSKTKIEIIDETVEFYRNNPRSAYNGQCLYKGSNGEQCAFQRVVEDDLSGDEGVTCQNLMEQYPDITFKKGYEGHNSSFWRDIQILHDTDGNWNGNELSSKGIQFVHNLKRRYARS